MIFKTSEDARMTDLWSELGFRPADILIPAGCDMDTVPLTGHRLVLDRDLSHIYDRLQLRDPCYCKCTHIP